MIGRTLESLDVFHGIDGERRFMDAASELYRFTAKTIKLAQGIKKHINIYLYLMQRLFYFCLCICLCAAYYKGYICLLKRKH